MLLGIWALLLLASYGYQAMQAEPPTPQGALEYSVPLQAADGSLEGMTHLHVFAEPEPPVRGRPNVLLLHGSPGSHADYRSITPLLRDTCNLWVPDLPGFGAGAVSLPDYSTEAHARYLLAWMEQANIERAHLVGFSMGGAVALHMWDLQPARVQSLTMLASIGVEELELLGDHQMNQALHGLLLGAVRAVDWLVPHFGSYDRFPVGVAHALNFFDSDQRKLRELLDRIDIPVHILHGAKDILVPLRAAEEHRRIVPQSELVIYPNDNHFLPWTASDQVASQIQSFITRVEDGSALVRLAAQPERANLAAEPFDLKSIPPVGGFSLVIMVVLLALASLVSEDLTCLAAGWLVAQGRLPFAAAVFGCFAGILIGDLFLYGIGRALGRPALERRPLSRFVSKGTLETAGRWFDQKGIAVIFLSRFTPGLRLPTYLLAGALRTRFLTFAGFFALASAIWTPALVGLSAWLGERFLPRDGNLSASLWKAAPWIVGAYLLLHQLILPCMSHAGRRRLVGRWKRLTEFEFWPTWVLYAPIVPYLFWQALRFRSLTAFSAANPGMPGAGFAGESKGDILDGFDLSDPASAPGARIARYLRLPQGVNPADRQAALQAWQTTLSKPFPLVLKPDVGERGRGVHIVREWAQVPPILAHPADSWIAQEFAGGIEFGVFYLRDPETERARVVSITEKRLPSLTGDGKRSVGQLVLDDARAVAMAKAYESGLGERWSQIPGQGEQVRLVEIGTHSLGSVFVNGARFHSAQLDAEIDALSRCFQAAPECPKGTGGLYLGRYDLKVPDGECLRQGRDMVVIELNGVTSEPTHIYDQREPLLRAWRTLARQWRWAFEIGAHHRARGVPGLSVRGLWRLWRPPGTKPANADCKDPVPGTTMGE